MERREGSREKMEGVRDGGRQGGRKRKEEGGRKDK